ncbi:MAG: hypothetical protein QGH45_19095 [Myxococcota bacterium]|nr:hypothetical protein [Myxococcota bacterium]
MARKASGAPHSIVPLLLSLVCLTSVACFELEDPALTPDGEPDAWTVDPTDDGLEAIVEAGCPAEYPELEMVPSGSQDEAWRWLNCYRNLAQVELVSLTPGCATTTDRHAAYMDETAEYSMLETQAAAVNYSGYDALERLGAAGDEIDLATHSVYEMVVRTGNGDTVDPRRAVDAWINTVYHRPPLLRPLIDGAGVGFGGQFGDMVAVGPWDTVEDGGQLLTAIYPAPGQAGVPPTFHSDAEVPDPAPGVNQVGSPISVTFQAGHWHDSDNHFDIQLDPEGCSVTPRGGEPVDLILLDPESDDTLWSTVVLLPAEPMEPGVTYDVEVAATIAGTPWSKGWTFTTDGS